jgi:cobalt-zinc-cadmium efflux system protein
MNVFSSHVCVSEGREGQRVLEEATRLLRDRFKVYFSTIQIEERCLSGEEAASAIDITAEPAGGNTRGGHHSG